MPDSATEFDLEIIGHRGAAGILPENTLPAFEKALALGCRWLELDVHCLADGTLAVIHDETLDRTTNRTGEVAALTQPDLQHIDAGAGAPIPTLEEVFTRVMPLGAAVNIELKGNGTAAPTAAFLAQQGLPGRGAKSTATATETDMFNAILVSSFNHDELAHFHGLAPAVPIGVLLDRWQDNWLELATQLNARAVNLSVRVATKKRVQEIQQHGYTVYVYTVNRLRQAHALAASGVDGIFTDRPDVMQPFLTG